MAGVAPPQLTVAIAGVAHPRRGAAARSLDRASSRAFAALPVQDPALTDFDALFLALPLMELQVLIEYEKGLFGRFPKVNPFW